MAVPKKKRSLRRRRIRRNAEMNYIVSIVECTNCNAPKKLHHACPKCGFYK